MLELLFSPFFLFISHPRILQKVLILGCNDYPFNYWNSHFTPEFKSGNCFCIIYAEFLANADGPGVWHMGRSSWYHGWNETINVPILILGYYPILYRRRDYKFRLISGVESLHWLLTCLAMKLVYLSFPVERNCPDGNEFQRRLPHLNFSSFFMPALSRKAFHYIRSFIDLFLFLLLVFASSESTDMGCTRTEGFFSFQKPLQYKLIRRLQTLECISLL
ncbi:hypothetical protein H113_03310 [Trichophyton rubrum MR1459]|nr:hypothetical protein H113_03310 [Trichophyton rubrum MR1459]